MQSEDQELILMENIFRAWRKFFLGKTNKVEVMEFWRHVEDNLFLLGDELSAGIYQHGLYDKFIVRDPKTRMIHKAQVRDRVVHQLIFDYLLPIFEKRFIFDSYSSRVGKGTHRAVRRLWNFGREVSQNDTRPCWILKCDIKKFFDSVDQRRMFSLIEKRVADKRILSLIEKILGSYETQSGKGLPLGNLTSQLFANIYLHELDYHAKHFLKLKYYLRFNDDFAIAHQDKKILEDMGQEIQRFLERELALSLPREKIILRKFDWGMDFLGYVILPCAILPRTKTRRRILKNIKFDTRLSRPVPSYLGLLKMCKAFKLKQMILHKITDNQSQFYV
jgi:retron-type reverse transcriptase